MWLDSSLGSYCVKLGYIKILSAASKDKAFSSSMEDSLHSGTYGRHGVFLGARVFFSMLVKTLPMLNCCCINEVFVGMQCDLFVVGRRRLYACVSYVPI